MEDIENNNSQLGDLKKQLGTLIKDCEGLYGTYNEKRNKVMVDINKLRLQWYYWYKLLVIYLVLGHISWWTHLM